MGEGAVVCSSTGLFEQRPPLGGEAVFLQAAVGFVRKGEFQQVGVYKWLQVVQAEVFPVG